MLRWIAMLSLVLAGGCSSFNKEWEQSTTTPSSSGSIEGAWQGKWTSTDGHGSGDLRCVVQQSATDTYLARFHATYWGMFNSDYVVTLYGKTADGTVKAAGDSDLGWLSGGVYHYEATVTPTLFKSTYDSKSEKGTFEMTRSLTKP